MKRAIQSGATIFAFMASLFYTGCMEGPAGPAGTNGTNGQAGTAQCEICHSDTSMVLAKQMQWANSPHNLSWADQPTAQCARCHTNEGFIQTTANGQFLDSTSGTINNPTPQGCYTCHKIHTNFDTTDWHFRVDTNAGVYLKTIYDPNLPDSVQFGPIQNIDSVKQQALVKIGAGTVCATCHQPRLTYRRIIIGRGDSVGITPSYAIKGDSIYEANTREEIMTAQTAIFTGKGGYEVPGYSYPSDKHTSVVTNGCPQCHMATPPAGVSPSGGNLAGGHTLNLKYMSSATATSNSSFLGYIGDTVHSASPPASGCLSCHQTTTYPHTATITNFDLNGVNEQIAALQATLLDILVAKGAMTSSGSIVVGWRSNAVAGAIWNYFLVNDDMSMGNHNFMYASELLENSILQLENNVAVAIPFLQFPRGTPSSTAPKGAVVALTDTVGKAATHTPTLAALPIGGVPTSCTASPALPAGYTVNATTCVVSGTPTAVVAATYYVITPSNAVGTGIGDTLYLKVIGGKPTLSFSPSTVSDTVGKVAAHTPTLNANGGTIASCSASPALPAGLSLSNTTCAISGTPTATAVSQAYTITATSSAGSGAATLTITVRVASPTLNFSPSTVSDSVNVAVTITPTLGGGVPTSCTSAPPLPTGLAVSATTCVISGTPTVVTASQAYTITATNGTGSGTATLTLSVP